MSETESDQTARLGSSNTAGFNNSGPKGSTRPLIVRLLVGFGKFWWDFLVGDTPEIFVGVIFVLGVIWALVQIGGTRFSWIAMPLVVADLLAISAIRASKATKAT